MHLTAQQVLGSLEGHRKDLPKTSLSATVDLESRFWTMPRGAGSGCATARPRKRARVAAVNFMLTVWWGLFGLVWRAVIVVG